ncbi:hypothetical protein D3C81_1131890 [compost metagenome]
MFCVGFLDQRREACPGGNAQRLAVVAGRHLGFTKHAGGPFGGLLGARPGLADGAILAIGADGRRFLDRAVVQQVVTCLDDVRGHPDGFLTVTPRFLPTDPADTVVAVVRFGFLHRHHSITAGLLEVFLHLLVLRQCAPTGLVHLVGHFGRHRLAGEL